MAKKIIAIFVICMPILAYASEKTSSLSSFLSSEPFLSIHDFVKFGMTGALKKYVRNTSTITITDEFKKFGIHSPTILFATYGSLELLKQFLQKQHVITIDELLTIATTGISFYGNQVDKEENIKTYAEIMEYLKTKSKDLLKQKPPKHFVDYMEISTDPGTVSDFLLIVNKKFKLESLNSFGLSESVYLG